MVEVGDVGSGSGVLNQIGLGGFSLGSLGTIGSVLLWVFVSLFVVGSICGFVVWLYLRNLYGQKIKIFGMVGNTPSLIGSDKGRFIRMGNAGDTLLHFRKQKKYQSPPTIQMGPNEWWFWKRNDGELINIGIEDIDEKMQKAGAYFVDQDMRMQRLGINKNLEQRLIKQGFLEKYGQTIASAIFVIFVMIALVVLFSKLTEVAESLDRVGANVGAMAATVEKFYSKRLGSEAPSDLNDGSGLVDAAAALLLLNFRRRKWGS